MRTRPILLSRTCLACGGRSFSEAKLPAPANMSAAELNLDDLGALVERQSLSVLLALVELLPYKLFTCAKCHAECKLENPAARELIRGMLSGMQAVAPARRARKAAVASAPSEPRPAPGPPPQVPGPPPPSPAKAAEWEAESLDSLFNYRVED